jgi:hypothetical protein
MASTPQQVFLETIPVCAVAIRYIAGQNPLVDWPPWARDLVDVSRPYDGWRIPLLTHEGTRWADKGAWVVFRPFDSVVEIIPDEDDFAEKYRRLDSDPWAPVSSGR